MDISPNARSRPLALAAAAIALILTTGACTAGLKHSDLNRAVARQTPVAPSPLSQSTVAPPLAPLAQMVERVLPSVVNVRVTQVALNPFGSPQEANAEGSGVIIAGDGVILTNNHVVAGAVKVQVLFNDGRAALEGTVVGTDPQHDLAVVRVKATDLAPMAIGRSGSLHLGDAVTAIGFPLDLGGPSVTSGIVSGLNRTVDVQAQNGTEHLTGLIQTDAAINPGNSGGPLVDALGQVVGINTAGVSAGAAENIGFAIAIDEAVPVVQQILTQPPAKRAWLGVSAASVDSSLAAQQLGLPASTRGAGVVGVVSGSPASDAGLRQGDVIVQVGDTTISSSEDLSGAIAKYAPGDRVTLTLVDRSGRRTVQVTFAQRPPGF